VDRFSSAVMAARLAGNLRSSGLDPNGALDGAQLSAQESRADHSGRHRAYAVVASVFDFTPEKAERLRPFFKHAQIVALMFVVGALVAIAQIWSALARGEHWIGETGTPVPPDTMRGWIGALAVVTILGLLVFAFCRRMSRKIADSLARP
jgi:hypothetical protein